MLRGSGNSSQYPFVFVTSSDRAESVRCNVEGWKIPLLKCLRKFEEV